MAIPATRKPIMTLYTGTTDPYSHGTRIVLYEKDVECQIVDVDVNKKPRELAELNPYNQVPTMVDRDLVLYDSHVINEYLDERLPHPPLMPVDPVNRARARMMLLRFDRDWYTLLDDITAGDKKTATRARTVLRDGLSVISPIFKDQQFIMGEEFGLVDCALAPLLWRLDLYGISLPRQAKPILDYADRVFARKSFKLSLTDAEKEMRSGKGRQAAAAVAQGSLKTYLFNAVYAWAVDQGHTPHVVVNAAAPGVRVPSAYVRDGRIVLNVHPRAVEGFALDDQTLRFSARFAGRSTPVELPLAAIVAVYAKESGEGVSFPEKDSDAKEPPDNPPSGSGPQKGPVLRRIK